MGDQPTFSVILPTYNRAHLLGRAIRSVLAQTYHNFELIIVDDASPDNTTAVVKSFDEARIVYIRHDKNGGASATRNTGIRKAKGKYISFLDDDDEYLPTFLAETYQVFETLPKSVGFTWSGICEIVDRPGGEKKIRHTLWQPATDSRKQAYHTFLRERKIGTGYGVTIRRRCFEVIGLFDEELKAAVDTDLFARLFRSFDFFSIPKVLINVYRHSGERLTKPNPWRVAALEKIAQKHHTTLEQNPELWAEFYWKIAVLHYQLGNKNQARKYMMSILRKRPLLKKVWSGIVYYEFFKQPQSTLQYNTP